VYLAADVDRHPVFALAIGDSARSEVLAARLVAVEDADLAAADDVVVVVTDRDAVVGVSADSVLLGEDVSHVPAPEAADRASLEPVVADQGALRARAWVHAEVGVVVRIAGFDHCVIANLKADTVAIVVPGRDVAEGEPVGVLQKTRAA
jgi:hypothetical protein